MHGLQDGELPDAVKEPVGRIAVDTDMQNCPTLVEIRTLDTSYTKPRSSPTNVRVESTPGSLRRYHASLLDQ